MFRFFSFLAVGFGAVRRQFEHLENRVRWNILEVRVAGKGCVYRASSTTARIVANCGTVCSRARLGLRATTVREWSLPGASHHAVEDLADTIAADLGSYGPLKQIH